ncbi:hypothetical protein BMS3Abin08_01078 [bacterium BMS3Abin08]|nr:hypothetical protein BMS3Abin08_01078 [bacterium BMS3Abin08]
MGSSPIKRSATICSGLVTRRLISLYFNLSVKIARVLNIKYWDDFKRLGRKVDVVPRDTVRTELKELILKEAVPV